MNARRSVAAALSAAALLTTAACGGGSSDGQSPEGAGSPQAFPTEDVTLTMWWWGEQEAPGAKQWLADTVKAYEAKHSNITIKTVLQTTDGLIPSFEAAAAAKQGPDIEYFWGGIYSQQRTGPSRSLRCRTTFRPTSSRTTPTRLSRTPTTAGR